MEIEELKKEYATQDNRGTAYPFYVQVQELTCVGVIADGYDVCCPFGDGETRIEQAYNCETDCNDGEELQMGYIWHPVEFFLTIKGAKEYMELNKHNHGELRTYVSWFERRNHEMRGLLKETGFKTED